MKKSLLLLLACIFASRMVVAQEQSCPVIPMPNQATFTRDHFSLQDNTPIIANDPALQASAHSLQKLLLRYTGVSTAIQDKTEQPAIIFQLEKVSNPEGYNLQMSKKAVVISAGNEAGLFYGAISFLQLARKFPGKPIPCWNIKDAPLYRWRGFMLDESRQFFGKAEVKKILDEMAFYKLNKFHWHLTDQPGWRIEIKQYPRLALVGGIGNYHDSIAPAQFYTQQDVEEIVAYAAALHISVIPEIDMPGHATAANRAYPQFSGGGSVRHPEFTFNPGKEETYQYLSNILKEVDVLFPSQMIHIGGDEVSFGNEKWKTDPAVQDLMKRQKLNSLLDVEHYFLKRMADTVVKLNNSILGWDEVTASSLPPGKTIVFWWRHEKKDELKNALEKGYKVVLCPRLPFYFDFVQDSSARVGRRWPGNLFNELKSVYDFSLNSLPDNVNRNSPLIEGIQANLWTETIASRERMYYLTFPRLIALAEAAWTKAEKKDFVQFEKRLKTSLPLLKAQGIYYFEDPKLTPEPIK